MNLKPFIFITCFTLLFFNSAAQNIPLSDFEETTMPAPYTTAWYPLNASHNEFDVSITAGQLNVTKSKYSARLEYDLGDGKLYAINQGEFGGALYYKPNDTAVKKIDVNGKPQAKVVGMERFIPGLLLLESNDERYKFLMGAIYLSYGNYQKIFSYKGDIYLQSGLAHMGINEGAFSKITWDDKGFNITNVLKLDDCPMAFDIYNNTIYLTTFQTFRIINNWQDKTVKDKLFWAALYPTSVAVKNPETIYIGMRGGYVQLNSTNGEIKFYKYKL
jgi:hypothetical protein